MILCRNERARLFVSVVSVVDCQLHQDEAQLPPDDRLQHPHDPEQDKTRVENGWKDFSDNFQTYHRYTCATTKPFIGFRLEGSHYLILLVIKFFMSNISLEVFACIILLMFDQTIGKI